MGIGVTLCAIVAEDGDGGAFVGAISVGAPVDGVGPPSGVIPGIIGIWVLGLGVRDGPRIF